MTRLAPPRSSVRKTKPATPPAPKPDAAPAPKPAPAVPITPAPEPAHVIPTPAGAPGARVWVGDCRHILPAIPECAAGQVDLVFADPPFNWKRAYDKWDDDRPEPEYLDFTFTWLDLCTRALKPTGSLWVNIPDTWAAEIVCYLKGRLERKPPHPLHMINWCIWHYRFGQNTRSRFISSKVHALYFARDPKARTWNPEGILEASDRATTYFDPRTQSKRDGMPPGLRVPLDVWYGPFWGRVQGNNHERRAYHDNQLPEAYLERVVTACSNPGDLVLDPFLGSGTTGVLAHALGRRFIGTEFSPDNAKLAADRIAHGPKRPVGQLKGASSAIHAPRRSPRTKASK